MIASVDPAAGKVTIDHEAIQSIGWPKMTMAFSVRDPKQLGALKPGQSVNFTFVKQGSDYVIDAIK